MWCIFLVCVENWKDQNHLYRILALCLYFKVTLSIYDIVMGLMTLIKMANEISRNLVSLRE